MVLLTMTPSMVDAIHEYEKLKVKAADVQCSGEPQLEHAAVGKPISHGQVLSISRHLRQHRISTKDATPSPDKTYHLHHLLRGSRVYIPPRQPPPEPSSEYTALMDRLRLNEESLAYSRLVSPHIANPLTFTHALSSTPHAYHAPHRSTSLEASEDDQATYADISRQLALIVNVLVSIVACSAALWMAARHWTTPPRLALSMGGSGLVAVAEVVVYLGYLRKVDEAKAKGKKHVERKEIIKTWVLGGDEKRLLEKKEPRRIDNPENRSITKRTGRKG